MSFERSAGLPFAAAPWLGVMVLSAIILVLLAINGILLSNNTAQRFWPVKHSRLVEIIRHGLHLCLGVLKTRLQLIKPFLVGYALCCLLLCDCVANPMAATSNQQAEQRQTAAPPTATAGQSEEDTAKSDSNTAPRRDALESLKMLFGHISVQLAIMPYLDSALEIRLMNGARE